MLSSFLFSRSKTILFVEENAFFWQPATTYRMYNARCSCIYHQRARNTICEYNGNPLVHRSVEGNVGTAVLYTFGSYVIFIPPPPSSAKPSRYYAKKLTLIMFCNMMVIPRFALILPSGLAFEKNILNTTLDFFLVVFDNLYVCIKY